MFKPRPKQAEVLEYTGGKMGVSAVPGSGKTATLSYLAAKLVATVPLDDEQEILIVTLVKSAVGNFAKSMANFLKEEFNLLPGLGYRVRTLHGLANDIVRERPGLVGLDDSFTVLDERAADNIIQEAVESWVRANPNAPDHYLSNEHYSDHFTRSTRWADTVKNMTTNFIRQAKDMQLPAGELQNMVLDSKRSLPLAEMCAEIYEQYERALRYRGAVDFQDLIRLALRVLRLDPHYLARLQHRWTYILEDEAQDSSKLQEDILKLLAGEKGNWVRVGDPNQAIYETFTTANPKYLLDFMQEKDVQAKTLPNSGRSTASIINLANQLITWSLAHPNPEIREKQPLSLPWIEPTPKDDPQGNPPDNPAMVHLRPEKFTAQEERDTIIKSLQRWLSDNPDKTCAVLLPINSSGAKMVQELRRMNLPYVENLRSTSGTRAVVGALLYVLDTLKDPKDSAALATAYRVWRRDERGDEEAERSIENIAKEIRKLTQVEDYIYPRLHDWLEEKAGDSGELYTHLAEFRTLVRRWQEAADLPIDQLMLTISADLFQLDTEIATAYSVALYLRRFAELHPEAQLPEYSEELQAIARGQRKFTGVSDEDDAFDPEQHKGKVTVTTMHKAKGLEWDRVYLMSANNYDYPSADPFDNFIGERWFIRDSLNLEAEALAQLDSLYTEKPYSEGQATQQARIEYASERLRLLYVGITRAKRELIITWNSGRRGEQVEAKPIAALRGWWQKEHPHP
ncbi:MAG: ATP-dependent helicase [Anaerolineae bacterium]|nr:ATP-dependent helicase [Anaerolineae bacterium]MDQ7036112.1 ATP-dependent helicase [Anaerolineae bacterium]